MARSSWLIQSELSDMFVDLLSYFALFGYIFVLFSLLLVYFDYCFMHTFLLSCVFTGLLF